MPVKDLTASKVTRPGTRKRGDFAAPVYLNFDLKISCSYVLHAWHADTPDTPDTLTPLSQMSVCAVAP